MPLKKGTSKKTRLENAQEMMASGHPKKQAWAAAYDQQRRSRAKKTARTRKRRATGSRRRTRSRR